MYTLILNSANIVEGFNNSRFTFTFPGGGVTFKNQKLALASVQMYYSNPNISSYYRNNYFTYTWIDGTVVDVTIPEGFYELSTINNYIHSVMMQNKHYYTDTAGNLVWLIDLAENATFYGIQLNLWITSSSIATSSNWTIPSGATWSNPTSSTMCKVTFSSAYEFYKLVGFTPGTYGEDSPTKNVQYLSDITPVMTPVDGYVVTCNAIENPMTNPNTVLYSFTPTVQFGSQMNEKPSQYPWCKIRNGSYTELTIDILDQNLRRVRFKDPSTTILLMVSEEEEM